MSHFMSVAPVSVEHPNLAVSVRRVCPVSSLSLCLSWPWRARLWRCQWRSPKDLNLSAPRPLRFCRTQGLKFAKPMTPTGQIHSIAPLTEQRQKREREREREREPRCPKNLRTKSLVRALLQGSSPLPSGGVSFLEEA